MQKKSVKIQIPQPCSERFDQMPEEGEGRHCSKCDRTLIDYTSLSESELAKVFMEKKGKICGQFHPSQLNKPLRIAPNYRKPYQWKAASVLLAGLLSASNLSAQNISVIDAKVPVEQNVINTKTELIGPIDTRKIAAVSGTIEDYETGETLIFANVLLKGTAIGTTTDMDGNFQLDIPEANRAAEIVLVVSYIGYQTKEITINDASEALRIQLDDDSYAVVLAAKMKISQCVLVGMVVAVRYEDDDRNQEGIVEWLQERKPIREARRLAKRTKKAARKAARLLVQKDKEAKKETEIEMTELMMTHNGITEETKPTIVLQKDYSLKVFPNPFNDYLQLEIGLKKSAKAKVSIFDLSGKLIISVEEMLEKGTNEIGMSLPHDMPEGMYLLRYEDDLEHMESIQVVKTSATIRPQD